MFCVVYPIAVIIGGVLLYCDYRYDPRIMGLSLLNWTWLFVVIGNLFIWWFLNYYIEPTPM
jgi:hypothetical protein